MNKPSRLAIAALCATLLFSAQESRPEPSLKASFVAGIKKGLLEAGVKIGVVLTATFIAIPVWMANKNRKYRAPESVQKQAREFLDAMTKKGAFNRFGTWWKKKLGYITIYEGANEDFFKKNPGFLASSKGLQGIHFPAGSFMEGKMTPLQLATLCHEIVHLYFWDTMTDQYYKGNETWYQCEYRADYTAMEILYKLGMHEAAEASALLQICVVDQGGMLASHPYVFGTFDAFYTCYKNCPELLKQDSSKSFLQALVDGQFEVPEKGWEDRYKTYLASLQEQVKLMAAAQA